MQKVNKIIKIVAAMLLSLALVTSCLVSGVFAKYVKKGEATFQSIQLKKWGLTVSSKGTNLNKEYTSGDTVVVKSSTSINSGNDNIIIPGSKGRLGYLYITGSSEVAYNLDFSGTIAIGDGYSTIVDEIGRTIDYFPIAIHLRRYDGGMTDTVAEDTATHCIVRLTPDAPVTKGMTLAVGNDTAVADELNKTDLDPKNGGDWTKVKVNDEFRLSMFESRRWTTISTMVSRINSKDSDYKACSLNLMFDETNRTTAINSVYVVEWEWAYDGLVGPSGVSAGYNKEEKSDGTVYTYQTKELDTQLGEKIRANADDFKISLDFSVVITSVNPNP